MSVAIIGGGYAGLAAAVELAARGVPVEVFEASRTLGGRARAVRMETLTVDNGAHILAGAYGETLRLMRRVGADPDRLLRRRNLHLEYPGRFRLHAPRLPAPLHLAWALLTAQGLGVRDKLAAGRFMGAMKERGFRLDEDMPVAALLAKHRQPPTLCRFLWEALCVAALNTPAERASAQVFLNVLQDSLAAGRAASDLLLPATDFSELFPEPAARFIESRGGRVRRGCRVAKLTALGKGYAVDDDGRYDEVIIAVAPQHLAPLAADLPELAPALEAVANFVYEPIVTVYLAYPPQIRLPLPMAGLMGGWAQWVFDRGELCGQKGLIAAVISAPGREDLPAPDKLAEIVHEEIACLCPALPAPLWSRVIVEKRATFACTPGLRRPQAATGRPGLVLAGDYVAGSYPATLEGAVRSGVAAAELIS